MSFKHFRRFSALMMTICRYAWCAQLSTTLVARLRTMVAGLGFFLPTARSGFWSVCRMYFLVALPHGVLCFRVRRALSTSWAWLNNIRVEDRMNATFWHQPLFAGWDPLTNRLYSPPGLLVVAQKVVAPHTALLFLWLVLPPSLTCEFNSCV